MGVLSPIRVVGERVSDAISMFLAKRLDRRLGTTSVMVLDIDNTLADTWPSFLAPHRGESDRIRRLEPLPGMKAATHDRAVADGHAVVYLSHRNFWHWKLTLDWLRQQGYSVSPGTLLLVSSPQRKTQIIARLARGRRISVWDDLTAGHESGRVRHYTDVRASIQGLVSDYYGPEEIADVVNTSRAGT